MVHLELAGEACIPRGLVFLVKRCADPGEPSCVKASVSSRPCQPRIEAKAGNARHRRGSALSGTIFGSHAHRSIGRPRQARRSASAPPPAARSGPSRLTEGRRLTRVGEHRKGAALKETVDTVAQRPLGTALSPDPSGAGRVTSQNFGHASTLLPRLDAKRWHSQWPSSSRSEYIRKRPRGEAHLRAETVARDVR